MPVLRLRLTPNQRAYTELTTRRNYLIGPKGEGKTMGAVCSMFAHAGRQDSKHLPIRAAIIRDTHENFQAHTVASLKRNFPNVFTFKNDYHKFEADSIEGLSFGVNDL